LDQRWHAIQTGSFVMSKVYLARHSYLGRVFGSQ
jgi:hypothetical protein